MHLNLLESELTLHPPLPLLLDIDLYLPNPLMV